MSGSHLKRAVAAVFLSATFLIVATICTGDTPVKPFSPGEKLTFQLKWGPIPAGEVMLELLPVEKLDNQSVYHFVMTVRTNAFVDLFYYYRSRIDAYADIDMTRSLRYREQTRTRRKAKNVVVEFNWQTKQARFHRVETFFKPKPDRRTKESIIPLLPGTFDPLSVYYYTRLIDLHEGERIKRPVSDGIKCIVAHAEIIRRESMTANGKAYDTFLVQPDFKGVNPVFEHLAGSTILVWVTADAHRIPVKLSSRIVLGRFTGELTAVEGVPGIAP